MSFLYRSSSRTRTSALFKNVARHARLASRFGHERSASTAAVEQCTILHRDTISQLDRTAQPLVPGLQLNAPILAQVQQRIDTGEQNAFYVVDTSAVEERFKLWNSYLPDVRPYYAVKCNPDAHLVQALARLGCGFDCASLGEIRQVLSAGVAPQDVIYANPCKQPSHVAFAGSQGVDTMTFDSTDELTKIKAINPNAKLVLRVYVDDTNSICRLGTKFGAMVHDVPGILAHAQKTGSDVIGVSFHVGSGCFNVRAYSDAVIRARKVFDIAHSMGFNLHMLDIGGGFPGTENAPISFEDCAKELQWSLAQYFPPTSGVQIISEPGRFFAASTHTLAVNVIGRKVAPSYDIPGTGPAQTDDANYMYFVNDGLYGSFNCMVYDHPTIHPVVLSDSASSAPAPSTQVASIWGPTCDGMDCIMKQVKMPVMEIGQWICFPSMGAYTCAAGSDFNGFEQPKKIYFDSNEAVDHEQQFVH